MRLTTDLATTGAQVIPVLAIGAVVTFRARARAHDQLVGPLSTGVKRFSQTVVELHDRGLRGRELVDGVNAALRDRRETSVGVAYTLPVAAVSAVLLTIVANLVAEVICLLVLSEAVAGAAWHAVVVLAAVLAGLVLLVVVPLLAGGPSWTLPLTVLRTPEYARARAILETAADWTADAAGPTPDTPDRPPPAAGG